jgi:5'-3' exoribonuclease 1
VLTASQRAIFDKVRTFVVEHCSPGSQAHQRKSRLTMPNVFPARDRTFINKLANDLHLTVTWDEYDEHDQNLVTWRFPGELEEPVPEPGNGVVSGDSDDTVVENDDDDDDDEAWEDEDDEESRAAVDRVLQKYEKAKVQQDDKEGDFDARYESSIQEKMAEWKRGYYKVRMKC